MGKEESKMKLLVSFVVAGLLAIAPCNAMIASCLDADYKTGRVSKFNVTNIDQDYMDYIEHDLHELTAEWVPEKYIPAFEYYTRCSTIEETVDLRLHILAVGKVESDWTPAIGKINKDGSYDIGYMQLNSDNIKDKWFIANYGPSEKDEFIFDDTDDMERYLIMCINFYKALYSVYGDDACYCYNCGERNYRKKYIPAITYIYSRKIKAQVNEFVADLEARQNLRLEEVKRRKRETEFAEFLKKYFGVGASKEHYAKLPKVWKTNNVAVMYNRRRCLNTAVAIAKLGTVDLNTSYIFVGMYETDTGAKAPVFLHRPTGKLEYC